MKWTVIVNRWNGCGSGNEYLDGGRRVMSKGGLRKTPYTSAFQPLLPNPNRGSRNDGKAESLFGYLATLLQHLVTSAGVSEGLKKTDLYTVGW